MLSIYTTNGGIVFLTYLGRELSKRKRQTALVSLALAIAIGLVVVVSAASAGINSAQSKVLSGLYGIGTDITVSQSALPTQGGARFDFNGTGRGTGQTPGQRPDFSTFAQDRLDVARFSATFDSALLQQVASVEGVAGSSATLKLSSISFKGSIPNQGATSTGSAAGVPNPAANGGGEGRGTFEINSKTIEGIDVKGANVGPLKGVTIDAGRMLAASDAGLNIAVVDSIYATANTIKVNDTLTLKSVAFKVVGLISSSGGTAETSSNIYIPLDTAQTLVAKPGVVTNIYISAKNASGIPAIKKALITIFPDATVSSQDDLAASLTGSLTSASGLVGTLGKWLSIIVLLVAFAVAGLFTSSGVNRRVREFGTLKAIGWRNSRIVRQIMGETFVTGAIAALLGLIIGSIGIFIVNSVAPTLSSAAAQAFPFGGGQPGRFAGQVPGGGGFGGGGFGGRGTPGALANATTSVKLHINLSISTLLLAIAIALLGALVAGAFGAWRASRLTPASAFRSVE